MSLLTPVLPATKLPSISELRTRLGYGDTGIRNHTASAFHEDIKNFRRTFRTAKGECGLDLYHWKSQEGQAALSEMAETFLEKEGKGPKYWPGDMSSVHFNGTVYPMHKNYIKETLTQLFFKLNQQQHHNEKYRRKTSSSKPSTNTHPTDETRSVHLSAGETGNANNDATLYEVLRQEKPEGCNLTSDTPERDSRFFYHIRSSASSEAASQALAPLIKTEEGTLGVGTELNSRPQGSPKDIYSIPSSPVEPDDEPSSPPKQADTIRTRSARGRATTYGRRGGRGTKRKSAADRDTSYYGRPKRRRRVLFDSLTLDDSDQENDDPETISSPAADPAWTFPINLFPEEGHPVETAKDATTQKEIQKAQSPPTTSSDVSRVSIQEPQQQAAHDRDMDNIQPVANPSMGNVENRLIPFGDRPLEPEVTQSSPASVPGRIAILKLPPVPQNSATRASDEGNKTSNEPSHRSTKIYFIYEVILSHKPRITKDWTPKGGLHEMSLQSLIDQLPVERPEEVNTITFRVEGPNVGNMTRSVNRGDEDSFFRIKHGINKHIRACRAMYTDTSKPLVIDFEIEPVLGVMQIESQDDANYEGMSW